MKQQQQLNTTNLKKTTGQPIKLPTMLPLVNANGKREHGLFATKEYQNGDRICEYWGKVLDMETAKMKPSFYMWEHVPRRIVIDAANVPCLAKYANNTVRISPLVVVGSGGANNV